MANNYTLMSVELRGLTEEEIAWFKRQTDVEALERLVNDFAGGGERDGSCVFFDCFYEGAAWLGFCIDIQGDRAVIYHDESADLENVALLLQSYLRKFHPEKSIGFKWAYICDKPRPDEFGGGACVVSAEGCEWMTTDQWMDQALRQEGKVD